jgi:hypothetical protein
MPSIVTRTAIVVLEMNVRPWGIYNRMAWEVWTQMNLDL